MNNSSKIQISKTKKEDISTIISIEKSAKNFVGQYSKQRHFEVIDSKDEEHFTIINSDSSIIGYIIIAGLKSKNNAIELRRIVITKKNKGYGRFALNFIKDLCFNSLKFNKLWLDVYIDNLNAIKLYLSEGFKNDGTFRDNEKTETGYRSMYLMSILRAEFFNKTEI